MLATADIMFTVILVSEVKTAETARGRTTIKLRNGNCQHMEYFAGHTRRFFIFSVL